MKFYQLCLFALATLFFNSIPQQTHALGGNVNSHDPSTLIKEGNTYWQFTTGDGIYAAYSNNLFSWTAGTKTVFPRNTWPAWINNYVPAFAGNFWAPDVIYMNGKYYIYYSCSTFGSSTSVIGVATCSTLDQNSPNYVWADEGMVVSSSASSNVNAIDPHIFKDSDGRVYLSYGSFSDGLGVVELDAESGKVKTGATLFRVAGGSGSAWEAPAIIKEGNYYYLFANRASCCNGANSTYYLVVGRSTSPTGPYLDKNGINLRGNSSTGGGTSVLTSSGRYIGPGHFGLLKDNGRNIVSMHYYDGNQNGNAKLDLAELKFTADGWPLITRDLLPAGRYKISSKLSALVWEAQGCTGTAGQPLVQNTWTNDLCQQWDLTPVGDGYYKISNAVGNQSIDVPSCNSANGTRLQTWTWLDNNCQKMKIEQMANGSYVFTSLANFTAARVVEVPNATHSPNTQLALQNFNAGLGQQWDLELLNVPQALTATTLTDTSFVARWNTIPGVGNFFLDVSTTPGFTSNSLTTIAGWNFENGSNVSNSGTAENIGKPITASGTSTSVYAAPGNGGSTAQATGWDAGNGIKYWEVNFSTLKYYNLKVSSKQRSNSTGPRHFKLQYKIGSNGTYTDIPGGYISTFDNYTFGSLTSVVLPVACENQPNVFLRWLMNTNTSVGNSTVAATGQSHIDDIMINGNEGSFVDGYEGFALTDTSTVVKPITPGITYYYRVRSAYQDFVSAYSNVVMVTPNIALPVTFTSIKAYKTNNDIQVEWSVSNEINIAHYELEKSLDGQNFLVATTQKPGNGSRTTNYRWTDFNASNGIHYYRVRAVEQSNRLKLTPVVKVNINDLKSGIAVYPNPIAGRALTIRFTNKPRGGYEVSLVNGSGQRIQTEKLQHDGRTAIYNLDLPATVPAGVYQLVITRGTTSSAETIILNK
ncbi:T9SS type A sorting domain-containing protein [Segetibacter sp. 3557_3]|uniref:family 43 glycosylhydrolase n=1 Tax=Segetibacter sp. 3557_3 TaxID=2547429 RepID=UPI0010584470|nr:family 43 glycosylhydrolase [Segetibacter sp. 3557_3]TDH26371.1 T9SS type A sorting domain-containing protein [Segetibacter sp. 3557_3]